MQFSETLAALEPDGAAPNGVWTAPVADTWLQGRSVFGGLQAALALCVLRTLVPQEVPLRVLQAAFMTPVPAGAVRVRGQVLRSGKNVTHAEARILDGERTAALVVGVFGALRPSRVNVTPVQPTVDSREPLEVGFVDGMTPRFYHHFNYRWLRGGLPFTASTRSDAVIEVSMLDRPGVVTTEEHILAVADSIPPLALSMLDSPAAGSSLTWTLEMLAPRVDHLPLAPYRLDAEVTAGQGGYTSQSVLVWGPDGSPVALSRQSMVVFG